MDVDVDVDVEVDGCCSEVEVEVEVAEVEVEDAEDEVEDDEVEVEDDAWSNTGGGGGVFLQFRVVYPIRGTGWCENKWWSQHHVRHWHDELGEASLWDQ